MMVRYVVFLVAGPMLFLGSGCAGSGAASRRGTSKTAVVVDLDDSAAVATKSDGAPAVRPPGVLYRAEVEKVRLEGAGRFAARFVMDPVMTGHSFVGFRLLPKVAGDPLFGPDRLQPGDVVTRVNGLPVGRPDEFMYAWEVTTVAATIEIDLLRGEVPFRLVYKVE